MRKSLLFSLFLMFSYGLVAQTVIKGKVTDDTGEELPGVNVVVKGTSNGTVTDIFGDYSLEVNDPSATLVFSFVGFESQEVIIGSQSVINVELVTDVVSLQEVVVIGYGTTTEKELTAAVSTIKSEDITKLNPARIENVLQGQISGVQITSGSGSPGGGQNIRIRGINSNGDNRPLIIVDGVRYGDDINTIDPNNIESITVLKDASAAIYGVLGANGVVIVTTKSGKSVFKPELSISGYYGIQETERKIDLLNATEYALLTNEAFAAGGQAPIFTDVASLREGTDWQDEVFESAPIQNYTLNYRGSTENTTYSAGASYFNQEGIVGGSKSEFDRVNVNLNVGHQLYDKLKMRTNLNYIKVDRKTLPENVIGSVLFNAINIAPTETVFDADGNFTTADNLGIEIINPIAQIANTFNDTETQRLTGLVGLTYEVIEGLEVESSLNFNYADVFTRSFQPEISYGVDKVFNAEVSSVSQSQQNFISYNIDNIIRYNRTFNEVHDVNFTLGNSVYKTIGQSLFVSGREIPNNSFEFADVRLATDFDDIIPGSSSFDTRQWSYFGRVEYNYESKYLFSGLVRRDATSIFAPENQVGYFFSLSGGWVFSDESFFPSLDFFDFGKLRVSYGELGNDRVPAFGFISQLDGEAEAIFDGEELVLGRAIGRLPNPELQWETTRQFDIGLDLDFFEGKIGIVTDFYTKTTEDLLIPVVPASGLTGTSAPGGSGPSVNAGEVRNRGFEFSITYNDEILKDLRLNVNFNYARNDNETISVNDDEVPVFAGTFSVGGTDDISRFQKGLPLGAYWGLATEGVFQTAEEVAASAQAGNAQPGDLRFVDQNNDGQIDDDDRTFIGSPIPENIFGFSLGLNYKNFDLSTLWEAQTGHSLVRNYERTLPRVNRRDDAIERWTGPGTSNTFPRLTTGETTNNLFSDFFIEDGDYLRIRNIQLGYSLPSEVIEKIGATKLRVYATVNNVFTFTDYQGYDPSASNGGGLNGTNDQGFYPLARTYMFGFNLTF
ncbi:MAG: SusC/RagA family TonB-linked outer membrane protein [Fulvivirga sp.]